MRGTSRTQLSTVKPLFAFAYGQNRGGRKRHAANRHATVESAVFGDPGSKTSISRSARDIDGERSSVGDAAAGGVTLRSRCCSGVPCMSNRRRVSLGVSPLPALSITAGTSSNSRSSGRQLPDGLGQDRVRRHAAWLVRLFGWYFRRGSCTQQRSDVKEARNRIQQSVEAHDNARGREHVATWARTGDKSSASRIRTNY